MKYNEKLQSRIDEVAEVAGYLWEKGWAERNGGNISYNITDVVDDNIRALTPISEKFPIGKPVPALSGNYFLVTGTGKRMRYVHSSPMDNASIIRISGDGSYYEIMAEKPIRPTSELPSHLMIHNHMAEHGRDIKSVIHTHPIELVAMTHNPAMLEKDVLGKILWSMIPETRAFCPKGLGIIPYTCPGTVELAEATVRELDEYDIVMWEKHGAVGIGADLIEPFDMIDTFTKSAKIYMSAMAMGFTPAGMTDAQMDEMKEKFNL